MTDRELKKLSRAELIEMMLTLSRENERLREALARSREQLADRIIKVENAGSMAEAALLLNGVFEAAQAAAEQYMCNIRYRSEQQRHICAQMEQETREKCDRMLAAARMQVDDYLAKASSKLKELNDSYAWQPELQDTEAQSAVQDENP